MEGFRNEDIRFSVLKNKAYNMRWAEVPDGVIPLTAADTDFPPAPEIGQALKAYIDEGYFPYVPKLGLPEFRESIARAVRERKNEPVDPDLVLPVDSAARGMYIIARAVLKPGDEAIIFDPVDFLFRESILAAGGVPVLFPAEVSEGKWNLEALETYITPRTKMIGLCNPHNPLGMVYSREELEHILKLSRKYGLWIMNDEIWSDIIYEDSRFTSILELPDTENVLTVYGFSKSFGIAGLRAGCIYAADRAAFDRVVEASDVMTTAGGISSLSQVAACACLDRCYYWVDRFRKQLTENRDYVLKRMESMPGIRCHKPQAAFVLFPDITGTGKASEEFCRYLKENWRLAVVPGGQQYFGPGSEGHIRICIATSHEILKEAMDRLEAGLCALQARK